MLRQCFVATQAKKSPVETVGPPNVSIDRSYRSDTELVRKSMEIKSMTTREIDDFLQGFQFDPSRKVVGSASFSHARSLPPS